MNEKRQVIEWMKVDDLRLDPLNPRLPEEYSQSTEIELTKIIARDYSLAEIGQSLVDNGYFSEEPLVAVPRADGDKYTVIEGNRRLAALKLLNDPSLASQLNLSIWTSLAEENNRDLSEVPVLVYDSRDKVVPYLGFRHIAGVLKWEPVAKARFISQLVESGSDFKAVAREIGSKAPSVRDNYIAYKILGQAESSFGLDTEKAMASFSVLYRALNAPAIRKYIGIDNEKTPNQLKKPVPKSKQTQLGYLLSWMFGDNENSSALRDSRQLNELAEVLENKKATDILRISRDLNKAFRSVGGEARRLLDHLEQASFHLDSGLPDAHRNTDNEAVRHWVERCHDTIRQYLRSFPSSEDES